MELPFKRRLKERRRNAMRKGKGIVTVDQQIIHSRRIVRSFFPAIRNSENKLNLPSCHLGKGDEQCMLLWKMAQKIHIKDKQQVSLFVGLVAKLHKKVSSKTVVVYFLHNLINSCRMHHSVANAFKVRLYMQYTHIAVDAGAPFKFY